MQTKLIALALVMFTAAATVSTVSTASARTPVAKHYEIRAEFWEANELISSAKMLVGDDKSSLVRLTNEDGSGYRFTVRARSAPAAGKVRLDFKVKLDGARWSLKRADFLYVALGDETTLPLSKNGRVKMILVATESEIQ